MRWTNYFEHPGDNRYMVFTFPNEDEAETFQSQLEALGIPFESHVDPEEREPHLFGVSKRHFKEALRENHLIKARTRTKFIPVAGLRWFLLVGTAALVALAIIGAFRTAAAQASGWELAIEGGYLPAAEALGAGPIVAVSDTAGEPFLKAQWTPTGGSRFAVRLERAVNESWRFSTGLTVQRMGANWDLAYEEVNAEGERTGQIVASTLRLRGVRYRIPVLATTSVRLTTKQRLLAGAGLGLDFTPSDVFAAGSLQVDSVWHDFRVAENRTRLGNVPLIAELGWAWRPSGWAADRTPSSALRGVYVGVHWSRELLRTRWGEATWEHQVSEQRTRLWMGPTAVALVARFTLS